MKIELWYTCGLFQADIDTSCRFWGVHRIHVSICSVYDLASVAVHHDCWYANDLVQFQSSDENIHLYRVVIGGSFGGVWAITPLIVKQQFGTKNFG